MFTRPLDISFKSNSCELKEIFTCLTRVQFVNRTLSYVSKLARACDITSRFVEIWPKYWTNVSANCRIKIKNMRKLAREGTYLHDIRYRAKYQSHVKWSCGKCILQEIEECIEVIIDGPYRRKESARMWAFVPVVHRLNILTNSHEIGLRPLYQAFFMFCQRFYMSFKCGIECSERPLRRRTHIVGEMKGTPDVRWSTV